VTVPGSKRNETPRGRHARAALPSGSRSVGLGSSADDSWAERKVAESATLIQVSHPRRLPSESIRERIDRLVLGHPDGAACCEDRRVRWASCKREVRDRGASPPSRALPGLEPTRILSAADGGTPLTRYIQARVPKCDIRPSSERRHGSRVLEPIRSRSSVGGAGRAGRQRHGHRADHAIRWCAVVLVEDFDTGCTSGSGDAHGD